MSTYSLNVRAFPRNDGADNVRRRIGQWFHSNNATAVTVDEKELAELKADPFLRLDDITPVAEPSPVEPPAVVAKAK